MSDPVAVLKAQWQALRTWLAQDAVTARLDRPSVLPGWTVADLIAHNGRSFIATELTVNDPDGEPQSLRAYVAHYPTAATEISDATRALAADIRHDLLGGLDRLSEHAFTHLDSLTAPVVRGLRGCITREDFVLTRLIEVVVHTDDLARSLPEIEPPPLLDKAVTLVSDALARAYEEAVGSAPSYPRGLPWIRLAAGRHPSPDPALPLL
ncbi:MAG: maleylpyruvate isomerase N-terminal domain-containing protein [Micromonosporaceae bacterium]|nr:maleylpyruvate isomerase N-terminal domain-containing protein [Micromonosporaceae bacterium]